jgi:hypothetical protein
MVSWSEVERAEPEFAAAVVRLFDAHKHKTIATLRADGSPRISGIEAEFGGGELTFGSMPHSRKGADLRRDPRFALHTASEDPPEDDPAGWSGDAKIAGHAVPTGPQTGEDVPEGDGFRADITEVVRTRVTTDELIVELWRPGHPLREVRRK